MSRDKIDSVTPDLASFNLIGAKILIVDDIPANLNVLYDTLAKENYEVLAAPSGEIALKNAQRANPDLILLDIVMPDINGYEVCRRLKQNQATADIPVIFITIREEKESLSKAFGAGGVDYITKPFEKEELLLRVETHLRISQLTKALLQKNHELQKEISRREQAEHAKVEAEEALLTADEQLSLISQREVQRWGITGFVGKSQTVRKTLEEIHRLHKNETINVLITGESGTGKELVARAIHFGGSRAKGPFIPVNCSAIPLELAESALFGHVRGAFTGANTDRKGYFELAGGGTVFLDEIGDMPLQLQAKLLRVLEDGCITRVGGMSEKRVDFRIIAATNADLQTKMSDDMFRQDLYFRLARFTVNVPSLRERREDIPLLIEHFLKMLATEMGIESPTISAESLEALMSYSFPGNVRELKNIIEYALILSEGAEIQPLHLHFISSPTAPTTPPDSDTIVFYDGNFVEVQDMPLKYERDSQFSRVSLDALLTAAQTKQNALERHILAEALRQNDWNREWTAKVLGIGRKTLYRKMREHHIE